MSPTVLLLPGWHNSGPDHWQSHWERLHGYTRVPQHDWDTPLRGDWMAQLDSMVQQHPRVVLVAHSLACVLVAAWAAHSRHTARVQAALLVAPGDVERAELLHTLHGWRPIVRQPLPFPATLIASRDDPHCRFERASGFARDWGAQLIDAGALGHINADSRLGDWPQGHAWLQTLLHSHEATHGH